MNVLDVSAEPSTEPSLPPAVQVAVGSHAELVITTGYVLLCIVFVLLGNGIVFAAVFKTRSLHTQHSFLLCSLAASDVVTCLTLHPVMVVVLFQDADVSKWLCRASGCLGIAAFFSTVYFLGLLAYERYHFFCHPLSYHRFFTFRKLFCTTAAVWTIPVGFCITTEIIFGRKLFVSILGCQLLNSRTMSLFQITVFFGPSLLLILWSTIRIGVSWARMRAKVVPYVPDQTENSNGHTDANSRSFEGLSNKYGTKIKRTGAALKLIILVSGLFWGTYIPGFLARTVIFSSGVTWEEIETRQNLMAMVLLRGSNLLIGTVSQVFNPWLYIYTHPEIRAAVKRMFSRKAAQPSLYVDSEGFHM